MPKDVDKARAKLQDAEQRKATVPIGTPGWREAVYASVAARNALRDAERRDATQRER